MKLIVGLGNPGERYESIRHNLGFVVVEQILKNYEPVQKTSWEDNKSFKSDIVTLDWKPKIGLLEKVMLVKPKTYMNNSGMAVRLIVQYYKIDPSDIWVLHDDIDLPLGTLRIRNGGSSAGHKGIESIIRELGTDRFWRFRLGIGHPRQNSIRQLTEETRSSKHAMKAVDEFVLEPFSSDEKGKVKRLIKYGAKAIAEALEEGLEVSMNKFNTK